MTYVGYGKSPNIITYNLGYVLDIAIVICGKRTCYSTDRTVRYRLTEKGKTISKILKELREIETAFE